jgi:hypothetical protein
MRQIATLSKSSPGRTKHAVAKDIEIHFDEMPLFSLSTAPASSSIFTTFSSP